MQTQYLHNQVKIGNLGAVLDIPASLGSGEGSDIKGYDSAGHTPLMVAVASEAAGVEIVRALIDHGADTKLPGKNPEEQDKSQNSTSSRKNSAQV